MAATDEANPAFEAQLARASVVISKGGSALEGAAGDFGRIEHGHALGVISVRGEAELHTVFQLASALGVRLTLRSGGNSQSGQSLAARSYSVSLLGLESTVHVDPESLTAVCSASSSWRRVVEAAAARGAVPKVVPLNLDLSVGGTLSAGGIGASSFRYGSACSNVLSLTAITGAGERVSCSRASRPDVFDAVLAGLGRTAVLTSATLSLRPARRHLHTVFAVYSKLRDCLIDMRFLAAQAACSYIEGSCSSCFQGLRKTSAGRQPLLRWFYGIQFSVEHGAESEAGLKSILEQLRCFEVVHREDDEHQLFLDRYQARFQGMRRSGAWDQAHPWFECILPADGASGFIEALLSSLPSAFGDGHRLFSIHGASNPKYLQLPVDASNTALAVAVLPSGVPELELGTALEFVRRATELLHRHGGKRYLSGWLGAPDDTFWRHHYGRLYDDWGATKRVLDPNGVLTSELFSS